MSRECQNCGAHVTDRFARVFGDTDKTVWGCPDCQDQTDIYDGAVHDPEHEPRTGEENLGSKRGAVTRRREADD